MRPTMYFHWLLIYGAPPFTQNYASIHLSPFCCFPPLRLFIVSRYTVFFMYRAFGRAKLALIIRNFFHFFLSFLVSLANLFFPLFTSGSFFFLLSTTSTIQLFSLSLSLSFNISRYLVNIFLTNRVLLVPFSLFFFQSQVTRVARMKIFFRESCTEMRSIQNASFSFFLVFLIERKEKVSNRRFQC